MEMNKARNMLEHGREIFSRPRRTWIQQQEPSKNTLKRPASDHTQGKDHLLPEKKKKKTKHIPNKQEDVRVHVVLVGGHFILSST